MSLGEFEIIARYFARAAGRPEVLLGVGDDAAVLDTPPGRRLVVAMDTVVEGVHFLPGAEPFNIGWRALAVNLSDLAAMGAEPAWMTLSLSLPDADECWLQGFADGLFTLAQRHEVALVGGDTVRGPRVVTLQVAGWVEADRWLTRAGARAGDVLMVSGRPGEAAGGLETLRRGLTGEAAEQLQHRFLRPEPRIALGRHLRGIASAAMDVSDGLLADLRKLCAASGCAAQLETDALPPSPALAALFPAETRLRYGLTGGDDYELLFTVPASQAAVLEQGGPSVDALPRLTRIGVMREGAGVRCRREGRDVELSWERSGGGYDHFTA